MSLHNEWLTKEQHPAHDKSSCLAVLKRSLLQFFSVVRSSLQLGNLLLSHLLLLHGQCLFFFSELESFLASFPSFYSFPFSLLPPPLRPHCRLLHFTMLQLLFLLLSLSSLMLLHIHSPPRRRHANSPNNHHPPHFLSFSVSNGAMINLHFLSKNFCYKMLYLVVLRGSFTSRDDQCAVEVCAPPNPDCV